MAAVNISQLLQKMGSEDKDFRYMAVSDLLSGLTSHSFFLEESMAIKVIKKLVQLLDDKNGEVQNMAVKCLPPLVQVVSADLVLLIMDPLLNAVLTGDEQQRDIAAIGLKSVVGHSGLGASFGTTFGPHLAEKLTGALAKKDAEDSIVLEILDILSDILSRFGMYIGATHETTLGVLLEYLSHSRAAVRKRAIHAIGCLSTNVSDEIFVKLISSINDRITQRCSPSDVKTYIQCIGAICRQCGSRMAAHVSTFYQPISNAAAQGEDDEELREACIQALEALAKAGPQEFLPYLSQVVTGSLEYLQYDPNFNYDAEDDDSDMDFGGSDDDDDFDNDDDDDDASWKVRRSAAKLIATLIQLRRELLADFYGTVFPVLLVQLREREEGVRLEVIAALSALLKQTQLATDGGDTAVIPTLQGRLPEVIEKSSKLLKDNSIKTRQAVITMLKILAPIGDGMLSAHVGAVIESALFCIRDQQSTSNLKLDTLELVLDLMTNNPPVCFPPQSAKIVEIISVAVTDVFYKIISEGLLVAEKFTSVLRPDYSAPVDASSAPVVEQLYSIVHAKLIANDVDQQVKERAILCAGALAGKLGDVIDSKLEELYAILLLRLKSELTSVPTAAAFKVIAASELPIHAKLAPMLNDILSTLSGFLRKKNRSFQVSALSTLAVLVRRCSQDIDVAQLGPVLKEVVPLLDISDLHNTQLALNVFTATLIAKPETGGLIAYEDVFVLPPVLSLCTSPVLHGTALEAVLSFLAALAKSCSNESGLVPTILKTFTDLVYNGSGDTGATGGGEMPVRMASDSELLSIPKQAHSTLAMCVATVGAAGGQDMVALATKFAADVAEPSSSFSVKLLALRTLGEIGKVVDLSQGATILSTINNAFNADVDSIRIAASYALGNVSSGNLVRFLPELLEGIRVGGDKQYALLLALREMIVCSGNDASKIEHLKPFLEQIWSLLFEFGESNEEGIRTVVSECLGKLIVVDVDRLLPELAEKLKSDSNLVRTTAATAFKFTISDKRVQQHVVLDQLMPSFLALIGDSYLEVRRMSLVAFSTAVHTKLDRIRALLPQILPLIYRETEIRQELIRIVEMGPFKQPFDDGLDTRKSAYECLHILLESCAELLDIPAFIDRVVAGLTDQHDIQMLCHIMLIKLSKKAPADVLSKMDVIIAGLNTNLDTKGKKNDIKQQQEKLEAMKKSAVMVINSLLEITATSKDLSPESLTVVVKKVQDNSVLRDILQDGPGDMEL